MGIIKLLKGLVLPCLELKALFVRLGGDEEILTGVKVTDGEEKVFKVVFDPNSVRGGDERVRLFENQNSLRELYDFPHSYISMKEFKSFLNNNKDRKICLSKEAFDLLERWFLVNLEETDTLKESLEIKDKK